MKDRVWRRAMWCAAAVLWTGFIWNNSLQPAVESAAQSVTVLEKLLPLLSWTGLAEEHCHTLVRKLAHLTEFAGLGAAWWLALRGEDRAAPNTRRVRWGLVLLLCLLTAGVDESIQRFVPGRNGQLPDVGIDVLGSVLGWLLAAGLRRCLRRRED